MTEADPVVLLKAIWDEASGAELEPWQGSAPILEPSRVRPERREGLFQDVRKALNAVLDENMHLDGFNDVDFPVLLYTFANALTDNSDEFDAEVAKLDRTGCLLPERVNRALKTGGPVFAYSLLEAEMRAQGPRRSWNFPGGLRALLPRVLAGCPADVHERALDLVLSGHLDPIAISTLATSSSPSVRLRVAFCYQVLGVVPDREEPSLFATTLREVAAQALNAEPAGLVHVWNVKIRVPTDASDFLRGLEEIVKSGVTLPSSLNWALRDAETELLADTRSRQIMARIDLLLATLFLQNGDREEAHERAIKARVGANNQAWKGLLVTCRSIAPIDSLFDGAEGRVEARPRLFQVDIDQQPDWCVFDADNSEILTWDDFHVIAERLSMDGASNRAVKKAVQNLPFAEAAHGTYEPSESGPSRGTCTCTVVKAPDGDEAYYKMLIGGPGETSSGECRGEAAASIVEEMLTSQEEDDPDIEWELDVATLRKRARPPRRTVASKGKTSNSVGSGKVKRGRSRA